MTTRRALLKTAGQLGLLAALPSCGRALRDPEQAGIVVNDVQSLLNATRVRRVVQPTSLSEIQAALSAARKEGAGVSIAGGRHAMGGQQFGHDTVLLDMTRCNRVLGLDRIAGRVTAEAGIQWPELMQYLSEAQTGAATQWTIREKQTGVDRVTLGGSLAANVHGRGLRHPPIIGDIHSFVLVDASGNAHHCSRTENSELFALAIGGYGLFGVIATVTLRLTRRIKVQRVVEVIPVKDLLSWVDRRIASGFLFGDCQYSTDLDGDPEAHPGIFACYRPVDPTMPISENQRELSAEEWIEFYRLARSDKKTAFERYSAYYLATSGQVSWSDTEQLAGSFDAYRSAVDANRGTEMITEIYVSRDAFVPFMAQCRKDFIEHHVDMTYGTIRFIEQDTESFLPWAKEASVCIICNLHVVHTDDGKRKAGEDFRRIIDRAIEFGGRYYLTYHRWATRSQVETCYPQFVEFLHLKRKYDPRGVFQSDWYRHYATLFHEQIA